MSLRTFLPLLPLLAACGSGASGATSGSSSTTTTSKHTSSSSTAGSGGASGTGGAAGQGGATGACVACDGACADTQNDPRHCGACDHACGPKQQCDHGACATPLCLVEGPICPGDHVCCGDACCPPWQMCCNVPGGSAPVCAPADAGACPTTCAACP